MNISYGNPDLSTVIRNTVTAGYRKSSQKWNIGINLSGFFTTNNIERITFMDGDGISHSTYQNIGKNQSFRLNANFSFRQGQKWSINFNGGTAYSHVAYSESGLSNSGVSFQGSCNGNLMPWKGSTIFAGIFLFGGDVSLQTKYPYMYMTNMGMNQRFLKDRFSLSLSISEPFRKNMVYSYDFSDPTFKSHSRMVQFVRSGNINASWHFGKFNANVKKARKSSSDDKMEGGNSANSGTIR